MILMSLCRHTSLRCHGTIPTRSLCSGGCCSDWRCSVRKRCDGGVCIWLTDPSAWPAANWPTCSPANSARTPQPPRCSLNAACAYLLRRGGQIDFFHSQLRQAVPTDTVRTGQERPRTLRTAPHFNRCLFSRLVNLHSSAQVRTPRTAPKRNSTNRAR